MTRIASVLEIDAAALRQNVLACRALVEKRPQPPALGVVLKANAYGHGLTEVLASVHDTIAWIDVITPDDAIAIRAWERAHERPPVEILVIGPVHADEAVLLADENVVVAIGDDGYATWRNALARAGSRPLRVHLHVDSGLGREGFIESDVERHARAIVAHAPELVLEGVLSHFANVEDVTEQEYARAQVSAFERAARTASDVAGRPLMRHQSASAATFVLPEAHFDVVRVGISLYGLWPSSETRVSTRVVHGTLPVLTPALAWRVPSQVVRTLPTGAFVGYGCTYKTSRATRVAVLPVGYADGYPRALSGQAHVLVDGKRCPVIGRVMMNHIVVDVTQARENDAPLVATLLGRDGDEVLSAEQVAVWADTIHYEIVARLGAHLRRVVVNGDAHKSA